MSVSRFVFNQFNCFRPETVCQLATTEREVWKASTSSKQDELLWKHAWLHVLRKVKLWRRHRCDQLTSDHAINEEGITRVGADLVLIDWLIDWCNALTPALRWRKGARGVGVSISVVFSILLWPFRVPSAQRLVFWLVVCFSVWNCADFNFLTKIFCIIMQLLLAACIWYASFFIYYLIIPAIYW